MYVCVALSLREKRESEEIEQQERAARGHQGGGNAAFLGNSLANCLSSLGGAQQRASPCRPCRPPWRAMCSLCAVGCLQVVDSHGSGSACCQVSAPMDAHSTRNRRFSARPAHARIAPPPHVRLRRSYVLSPYVSARVTARRPSSAPRSPQSSRRAALPSPPRSMAWSETARPSVTSIRSASPRARARRR